MSNVPITIFENAHSNLKKKKIETIEINISLLERNLELCQQI